MNTSTVPLQSKPFESFSLWSWESFLLGGASIITCLLFWIFVDKSASLVSISQFAFLLAFAVNHPHFLSSYILLYGDFRKTVPKDLRYWLAAVIVPTALAVTLIGALIYVRVDLIGHTINAMFFLVGWHYVKQIFGCIIVTSVVRKIYYTQIERNILLGNLASLWSLSFISGQSYSSSFSFYGITYHGLNLPPIFLTLSYMFVALTSILVVGLHFRKYIVEGVVPSGSGLIALAALYVWNFPAFRHPAFNYFIPFFHSLQYLAFVWRYKQSEASEGLGTAGNEENARKQWVVRFFGFMVLALVLGALSFEFVPKGLGKLILSNDPSLGTAPILVVFLLFINIHHYFIDNVIWRSTNKKLNRHLFQRGA